MGEKRPSTERIADAIVWLMSQPKVAPKEAKAVGDPTRKHRAGRAKPEAVSAVPAQHGAGHQDDCLALGSADSSTGSPGRGYVGVERACNIDDGAEKYPNESGDHGETSVRFADLPDVMTVEEAGKFLRLCRSTTYDAVRRGDIPTFRVGRRIRVSKLALEAVLNGKRANSEGGDHEAAG